MAKRLPKTKFPTASTVSYERALVKMVSQVGIEASKLFDKHVANELMHADAVTFRSDGIFDGLKKMLSALKSKTSSIFSDYRANRASSQFVKSVNQVNCINLEHQARVKGIDLVANEPWLKGFMHVRINNNVSYIKNLENETYERIEDIVREHIENGSSAKTIREAIIGQTDICKSRAQFLAVDQAGSMLGQMTAERHQRLGIERFTWDTSGDERVRDEHKKLDGKVFSYDDPPTVNGRQVLPGEDYRCRCVALPVFDDED
ncbi:MAG: minor capsid protein [Solibacillus sp.]